MHARFLLALTVLLIGVRVSIAADDRSVESPEAVRAILDQGMPELINGKASDVLRKIAPDSFIDEFSRKLQSQLKPIHAKCGSPVGWTYVGARKRGDAFLQHVYLCRCESGVIIWRISAAEDNGRWRLIGALFDTDYWALFAQTPTDAASEGKEYARLADDIVDALAHGRSNAVDLVKTHLLESDARNDPQKIRNAVEQMMAVPVLAGSFVKSELDESKNVAGVLVERHYLLKYQHDFLNIYFLLYRPDKKWKLLAFNYHSIDTPDQMFGNARLELKSPPTPSRPSHAIIGSHDRDAGSGRKER
jgi:hypothetical protein